MNGLEVVHSMEEAVLVLTNEHEFYKWVESQWVETIREDSRSMTWNRTLSRLCGVRRRFIKYPSSLCDLFKSGTDMDRCLAVYLIRHYTEEFHLPSPPSGWLFYVRRYEEALALTPEPSPISTTELTEEEPTMKKLFEVKTYISGVESGSISDSDIYSAISGYEEKIQQLSAIKNKPKRLKDEIAAMQAEIDALVAYLDGK